MSDDPPLLRIQSSAGTLELRGPHAPPAGLMAGITLAEFGSLNIGASHGDVTAEYLDPSGHPRVWRADAVGGPLLFEQTTYHVWLDGTNATPVVIHRDPQFSRNLTCHDHRHVTTGTINLEGQIGLLDFTISVGQHRLRIELEVVPTKIDYASDYAHLVADVAASARGLALAYLRSTHQRADRTVERATEIEWLTALRQDINDLQRAIARIARQPHRHLLREPHPTKNHRIRRIDAVSRRAIRRGRGTGPTDQLAGVGPIRRVIISVTAVATLDTPEHRWLTLQLRQVQQQLHALAATIDTEANAAPRNVSLRRSAERHELAQLTSMTERLLDTDCLRAAQQFPQPSPPSLTLLSAPGYRDAYRILTGLRLGLDIGGDALDLQTKDVHHLYELWAFLEIVNIIAAHAPTDVDTSTLINAYGGGLRIGLRAGTRSDITLAGKPRSFILSYNRTYRGQTGDQRPDIVIKVVEPDQPDLIVVLDAKYRVDATTEFRQRHGAPGPPIEAINALHRYRDAIVTDSTGPVRPVVRGAALFPLTAEETGGFEHDSNLYAALSSLGIGAVPFLPGNTSLADNWLTEVLSLPTIELAWDGPPRAAALVNPP